MDNFEEKFLEQLAKARARLEGKEAYDDEAIKNEFSPDVESVKNEASVKKAEKPKPQKPIEPAPVKEKKVQEKPVVEKKAVQPVVKKDKPKAVAKTVKKIKSDKKSLVCGCAVVFISFALSCLGLLVDNNSDAWNTFKAYMPFIGIICGSVSVIWGALLIKKNKKGAAAIILGLLAMLIPIFISSLGF